MLVISCSKQISLSDTLSHRCNLINLVCTVFILFRICKSEWYPGIRFLTTVIEPALISEPKVTIVVPTETGGWNSRIPCEVCFVINSAVLIGMLWK